LFENGAFFDGPRLGRHVAAAVQLGADGRALRSPSLWWRTRGQSEIPARLHVGSSESSSAMPQRIDACPPLQMLQGAG
jgi:hypothetical protein